MVLNLHSTSLRLSTFSLQSIKLKSALIAFGPNTILTNVSYVSSSLFCRVSRSFGNSSSSMIVSWRKRCLISLLSSYWMASHREDQMVGVMLLWFIKTSRLPARQCKMGRKGTYWCRHLNMNWKIGSS